MFYCLFIYNKYRVSQKNFPLESLSVLTVKNPGRSGCQKTIHLPAVGRQPLLPVFLTAGTAKKTHKIWREVFLVHPVLNKSNITKGQLSFDGRESRLNDTDFCDADVSLWCIYMICHHRHLKLSVRDGIRTELILQSVYNMLDAVGAKPKDLSLIHIWRCRRRG